MQLTTPTLKIAVLDRGFVYVGMVRTENGALIIDNAQNIQRWGTSNGLGQLAARGPTDKSKINPTGTISAPMSAVIHLIDCNDAAWADTMAKAA